jgi:hypothetical protein
MEANMLKTTCSAELALFESQYVLILKSPGDRVMAAVHPPRVEGRKSI